MVGVKESVYTALSPLILLLDDTVEVKNVLELAAPTNKLLVIVSIL